MTADLIHPLVLKILAEQEGITAEALIARLRAGDESDRNERVLEAIIEKRTISKRRDRRLDGRYYEQAAIEFQQGKIGGMIRRGDGRVEVLMNADLADRLVVANRCWHDFLDAQREGGP